MAKFQIKGGGTFLVGATRQVLNWRTQITLDELKDFLLGKSVATIERAPWLFGENVAETTYLNLHLPKSKSEIQDHQVQILHHELGWIGLEEMKKQLSLEPAVEVEEEVSSSSPALCESPAHQPIGDKPLSEPTYSNFDSRIDSQNGSD